MNIIFSGFIHPFIGVLTGILLSFGTENLGRLIFRKLYPSFFFLNLVLGITTITLFSYICILLNFNNYVNFILSYFLIILGFIRIINLFNIKFKNLNFDFFQLSILSTLLLLFLISISPPSMSDSLAYHLGVAKYIYLYNHWPNPSMWLHANISGFGEVYNTLGLFVYSDTAGTLIQYFALISFLYYFSKLIKDYDLKIIFNLLILSSPVIIFLLSGSKFLILPQLVTSYILFYLLKNKKINNQEFFLIVFLLCGISNFKLNFIIPSIVLGIFALTKINFNFKNIFISIFLVALFFAPKMIFNYQSLNEFNIISLFSNVPSEFINTIKNYRESSIVFPLNLFLFESVGQIGRMLGFGIFIFIFLKKLSNEIIIIIFLIIINSIFYYLFSMSTSRMFYEMLLWSSLILLFNPFFKLRINIIKYFLTINLSLTFLLLLIGTINLSQGLLSNDLRTNTMTRNSYEYNAAKWLNKKISNEKIILTDLRSLSLLNMNSIPTDYLQYNLDEKKLINYKKFLKSKKIDFLVIKNYRKNTNILNNIFDNCELQEVISSPKFKNETRNPYNRNLEYHISILKYKTDINKCIK